MELPKVAVATPYGPQPPPSSLFSAFFENVSKLIALQSDGLTQTSYQFLQTLRSEIPYFTGETTLKTFVERNMEHALYCMVANGYPTSGSELKVTN